jgi:hypothetical protein
MHALRPRAFRLQNSAELIVLAVRFRFHDVSELGCLDAFNVGGSLCSNLIHSSHNLEHSLKPLFQKGGLGDSLHSTPPWGGIARVRGSALLACHYWRVRPITIRSL